MALREKLTSLANSAAGRANNAIENGKLGLKINGEERKINEYTMQIGELLVDKLDNGETFDDEIAALYSSIQASREIIVAARSEIEANRQENEAARQAEGSEGPVCADCGAPLSPLANFCSQCGAKVEQEPEAPAEPDPDPACPACGAEIKEEDKFCEQCGTPVEPAAETPAE